jgi:hypothetical protein
MRFVAALLGLRAQDMKTGAPAHFHLRYATVKTSHTPGTLCAIRKPAFYGKETVNYDDVVAI